MTCRSTSSGSATSSSTLQVWISHTLWVCRSCCSFPPCVVWQAQQWSVKRPGWGGFVERHGEQPALLAATVVACGTDLVAEQAVRLGVPPERVLVTPTGVDLGVFSAPADAAAGSHASVSATSSSSAGSAASVPSTRWNSSSQLRPPWPTPCCCSLVTDRSGQASSTSRPHVGSGHLHGHGPARASSRSTWGRWTSAWCWRPTYGPFTTRPQGGRVPRRRSPGRRTRRRGAVLEAPRTTSMPCCTRPARSRTSPTCSTTFGWTR